MRLTYLSVLPLFVLSLLACKPSSPPMQIGLTQQACDGSLYLASYLQFWSPSDAGIQVYADDSHTYAAFKEGRVDAASLYPHEVLTLWSENIPATIVLVLEVSNGADTLVAQSSISTLRDLRGKTIAIGNNPNNLYLLHRAIESVALSNESLLPRINTTPLLRLVICTLFQLNAIMLKICFLRVATSCFPAEIFQEKSFRF